MSDYQASIPASAGFKRYVPDLPLVIWMVLLTLLLGLMGGLPAVDLIAGFNQGFGRALGEFALILLPSFTLAAALSRQNLGSDAAGRTAAMASPIAGAGMICPDTAYAALSPVAGRYKLDLAFGAYAGFKLLYPAGPLIVAAGLGIGTIQVEPVLLLAIGVGLTLPVWLVGVLWGRWMAGDGAVSQTEQSISSGNLFLSFAPFALMACLLLLGGIVGKTGIGVLDFLLMPKGALLAAALLSLLQVAPDQRRDCLDSAVRRTGSLLLVIGAASAFGSVLTGMVALDQIVPAGSGLLTLLALFALTILFKLAQGSSMATFAAIAPVAAPIVAVSGVNPIAAIFAICLGSFVAILPNDSYYWLVRRDALAEQEEGRAIWILSGGAILQAAIGMVLLLAGVMIWT
ncbi:permease [Cohaesibacter gelatinilyticus]|uniref:Gluconate:H+ symporter, GntP family n=1 Tax=Cohaesibacter gelatinilyticus TaxID=372072 RepID=A0A285PCH3_9HYPH|nr:permease [Cohaesibacter gelatinilyticus]SNZ19128.1 gluconate:H+ symporter, GntP family [Cohaesibacter gelatinilyticus]